MNDQQRQESYADKIAKLLRKAESTSPEEAELLFAKAQELMAKYAIDEAMLESVRTIRRDEIVTEEFVLTGIFRVALGDISLAVLRNNSCQMVLMENLPRTVAGKYRKQTYILVASGYKSDIDRARALDASLQIQALRAQTAWGKAHKHEYSERGFYLARRQFLFSFAQGMNEKLMTATAAGRKLAEEAEAERSHTSQAEASNSVELVLVSRKSAVEKYFAEKYPRLRTRHSRQTGGGHDAHAAGQAAGRRADVGQPGVTSNASRRQIRS